MNHYAFPIEKIKAFAEPLGLSDLTINKAKEILEKIRNNINFSHHRPSIWIAGALYIASTITKEKRSQFDISRCVNISEMSIRKCYKKIVNVYGEK